MLGLFRAGIEVDVGKGVEFGHDDVDVVATDARGEDRDTLALIGARDAMELAAADLAFLFGEMGSHSAYSARIAHKDDAVGKLFGTQMQVER